MLEIPRERKGIEIRTKNTCVGCIPGTVVSYHMQLQNMMIFPDDDEPMASTVSPLLGVASSYKSSLDELMSFMHGVPRYSKTKQYTKGELRAITPHEVVRWMNLKTYGNPDPPIDSNPLFARSNSLAFWKKAISFFVPDRLAVWVSGRNEGNPTRSIDVNNLIKRVKKKEVRKQGVLSKVKRPLTDDEFGQMQKILQNHNRNNYIWRYGLYALANFQFHLIARIDDTTQVLLENIQVHDSFPNALKTRMNWSKNVTEERDAPWQLVLGCMDTVFCVLTSLAVWLEMHFRWNPNALLSPYVFSLSDDIAVPAGGKKSKDIASKAFTLIFKMDEFTDGGNKMENGLGTHSTRKAAAARARRSGRSKDELDLRGRWKSRARVSSVYEDTELPYPDAKVCGMLCIGGPCLYLFPEELTNTATGENIAAGAGGVSTIAMMKTFVLSNVVPNIRKRMSDTAALVLGKALLWLIYSPYDVEHNIVPQDFKQRIKMELKEIITATVVGVDCDDAHYNPITRVPVVVTGDQGRVYIDVVPALVEDAAPGNGVGAGNGGGIGGGLATTTAGLTAQLLAVQSLASQIRRELQELRANQMADRVATQKCFATVNSNIRRIALQPGVRGPMGTLARQGNDDIGTVDAAVLTAIAGATAAPASLSPNPKNLYEVWQEYQVGSGGRKPAKLFTIKERGGKVKHKYHRRNILWKMVSGLVRTGMTADTAIDQIYAVYGQQTSVTNIINAIKRDQKSGMLNPNLRV